MNKMEYQKPWAEFVEFSNEDIITASGEFVECIDSVTKQQDVDHTCHDKSGPTCTGPIHEWWGKGCSNKVFGLGKCWEFNGTYSVGDDTDLEQW